MLANQTLVRADIDSEACVSLAYRIVVKTLNKPVGMLDCLS